MPNKASRRNASLRYVLGARSHRESQTALVRPCGVPRGTSMPFPISIRGSIAIPDDAAALSDDACVPLGIESHPKQQIIQFADAKYIGLSESIIDVHSEKMWVLQNSIIQTTL